MTKLFRIASHVQDWIVAAAIVTTWFWLVGTVIWIGPLAFLRTEQGTFLIAASFSILVAASLIERLAARDLSLSRDYIRNVRFSMRDFAFLLDKVVSRKQPLVRLETSTERIAKAAAKVVRDAISSPPIDQYQLVFFGAVGFQVAPDDWRRESAHDDNLSPHQVYHGALEELASKAVPVARFVNLLTSDELDHRSASVRRRYLSWLDSQHSQMRRNPNFVVINSPRAPKWGATGGCIISSKRMVQFTHSNGCAIVLDDDRSMAAMVKANLTQIYGGKVGNIHAYKKMESGVVEQFEISDEKYQFENIDKFEDHMKQVKAAKGASQKRK